MMMTSGEDVITTMLRQLAQRTADVIEQACEKALASGYCGVRVEYHTDLNALKYRVKAIVDPRVPYGTIEEHHYTDGVHR